MKTYTCICGRTFDNPQKFNGHKQGCKQHILTKYKSLQEYYQIKNRNYAQGALKRREATAEKQRLRNAQNEAQLEIWKNEQHTCERCGKVMSEKYGSGRFCSSYCCHSRVMTDTIKNAISEANKVTSLRMNTEKKNARRLEYAENPKLCEVCGCSLDWEHKYNKTCSIECSRKLQSFKMKQKYINSGLHRTVRKRYKYGTYKGIPCDSSWELAFVMYLIDKNIPFERNTKDYFSYTYKGETHNFFPDFILSGMYYELKNYPSELTDAKVRCFPKEYTLKVLYYNDIKVYLRYAIDTYGHDFYYLYDEDKPSWYNELSADV